MEEEKKEYYWIKLKKSLLTSRKVDYLMSQENGANYVVLYQILCLLALNTNGELATEITDEILIPFDALKIQREAKWFSIDTVKNALLLYSQLGLIYSNANGILAITNYQELVGSESKWAKYKRDERERKQIGQELDNVQQENKSIRVLENKDNKENKSIKNNITYCFELPLRDGTLGGVTEDQVRLWEESFPAIDIMTELNKAKAWCLANPKNQKTKSGYTRFLLNWLSRAQDRAPRVITNNEPIVEEVKETISESTDQDFEDRDFLKEWGCD